MGIPPFVLPGDLAEVILDDLKNADPLVQETAKATASALKDAGVNPHVAELAGAYAGGMESAGMSILATGIAFLVRAATPLLIKFLKILTKFRTEHQDAFGDISAAVLSEFLATDIKLPPSPPGQSGDATIATSKAIGTALLKRLEQEFAPGGTPASVNGEAAARTFSGYSVNFAVQNAILGAIADGLSFHHLTQIREIGEDVARGLGLGRLVRSSIKPLVDNTIAKPYDRILRAKYRQDAISEGQLVKALHRGHIPLADIRNHFAQKGYPEVQIDELIAQLTAHLSDTEANLLWRYGVIDETKAVGMLVDEGWPDATARLKLKALATQKLDGLEGQYVNALETLRVNGYLTSQDFAAALGDTHLSDAEKTLEIKYVSTKIEFQRGTPTLAQMQSFYTDGIITLSDWDAYLDWKYGTTGSPPGEADVKTWLTYEMLLKVAAVNAKAAKGKVKLLTIAQLTKAWKGGTITPQQLQDYLAAEGYAAADVFRLMAQIIATVATPAAQQAAADLNAQADAADLEPDVTPPA